MTFLERLKVSKPGLKDPAGKAGSLWFIMTRDIDLDMGGHTGQVEDIYSNTFLQWALSAENWHASV